MKRQSRRAGNSVRQPINCRRRTRFERHVIFSFAKFLPNNDYSETQQDCVEHADGRKFEARDLIVGSKLIQANAFANDDRPDHRDECGYGYQGDSEQPKRRGSQQGHGGQSTRFGGLSDQLQRPILCRVVG